MPILASSPCTDADVLCQWAYSTFGDSTAIATVVMWMVGRPLRVVIVALVAWIVSRLARRWIRAVVKRAIAPDGPLLDVPLFSVQSESDIPGNLLHTAATRREARATSVSTVITSTVTVAIWTIAGITMLSIVGIDIAPLIAGAGIAGIALGFGAQALVKDCIAGLFMLIEDQLGIGDIVDIGDAVGVVEKLTLRATVVRSFNGTVWHVPNGVINRVGNRSQVFSIALLDFSVAYDADLVEAQRLIQQAADEVAAKEGIVEDILEPPRVLGVEDLGADAVSLRLTVKVEPGSQYRIQRELRQHVKAALDNAGIEIPFPQRTVWIRHDQATPDHPSAPLDE
ncbi:MAG: mechanosensitive ion channel protein MscS [Ilumatobacter coccineus]|uniref:Mechanosensitive ion channel protein MscS n=1 Tax=Ilumatobacter coccineus TaxID=467094 RepID=A0A2G6KG76_9ACTN|nr:MAG: mechanosensitive ion channel protein MscS [Ilumatobacter coccineus]